MAAGTSREKPQRHYWEQYESESRESGPRWSDVDGDVVYAAIVAITDEGDGVTFGRSQDGGALAVSVLTDGRAIKSYFHLAEAAENRLKRVVEDTR